jgi:outer membrane lipoprotein-sorting protein
MKKPFAIRLALVLLVLATCNLQLATHAYADLRAGNAEELKRIAHYLTSLTTITADFTQVAPDGSLTGGKFYLKRPGKMRWQYDPPTPILMLANGYQLIFYDYDLDQLSYIPIDSTLASFLARETIDLNDSTVKLEDFQKTAGVVRLTLSQAGKPEAGKITLEFADTPLQLRNMIVVDAQGQTTTVALNNAQYGQKLDNKLFTFDEKRKRKASH